MDQLSGSGADGSALAVTETTVSSLTVGRNTLDIVATAENGKTTQRYTITVTRIAPSRDTKLTGATVAFTVTTGEGTLSVTTATTDENGRTATTLTLGSQPGTNTVVASADDLEPVTFTAIGLGVPRNLTEVSGLEQQGPAGATLTNPFVVLVLDQNGDPVVGATVTLPLPRGKGRCP